MNDMLTVHDTENNPIYEIVFRDSFDNLADEIERLGFGKASRLFIVSDSTVGELYLEEIKGLIQDKFIFAGDFVFEKGEKNKNLDTVEKLYEKMIIKGLDRKSLILALGGGVVGDLSGFAAATFLRGIDFIQIPTTLLSMVDSSVGGKTGVDLKGYKNMVGAFKMPRLVYMNVNTLKTLPERQLIAGMAEVIKYGYILDEKFIYYLNDMEADVYGLEADIIGKIIYSCCGYKRDIVEEDRTCGGKAKRIWAASWGVCLHRDDGGLTYLHGAGAYFKRWVFGDEKPSFKISSSINHST